MQAKIKLPISLSLQHCLTLPNIESDIKCQATLEEKSCNEQVLRLIKSSLPATVQKYYPVDFVKMFLLIKINSLSKSECGVNCHFLKQILTIYNHQNLNQISVSCSEAEIMSQILLKVNGNVQLSSQQLRNILQGNGLLATSCVWLIKNAELFLKKQQYSFCLSFVALGGRQMAFIPIVHQEKYHIGQIHFAKRIRQLFSIKKKSVKEQIKVQDPYSMRCSPQVYGVAYDCLFQIKNKIINLLNKPHIKNIKINGVVLPNLLLQSDTYSLKMDFLICSLQQIGATMFLRTQRLLNDYLGKNNLKQFPQYLSLLSMLKSAMSYTSKNKILSQMTNFDTVNIDNYDQDIFYNSGSYFNKTQQLFNNLNYVLTIELLTSIQALKRAYQSQQSSIQFINEEMHKNFNRVKENLSPWSKSESVLFVKNLWLKL